MTTSADALTRALQYHQAGQLPYAEQLYRQILEADPANALAWHSLGIVAQQLGRQHEALDCLRRAVEFAPGEAAFHNNLGLVYQRLGQLNEAVAIYQLALRLRPDFPEAHNQLGNALRELGRLDEAIASYREAVRLRPDFFGAYNNLGNVYRDRRQLDEASACYRQALHLRRDWPEGHNNLGNVFRDAGQLDEASACYRHALALRPDYAEAHNHLGNTLKDQGRLDEAIACYQRARQLKPQDPVFHSNLVCALYFHPGYGAQAIYEESRRWDQEHAAPLAASSAPHANDRAAQRRLRVGYVSPDFRAHPVARFLLPLLEAHSRDNVEVFCYASVHVADSMTERCRAHADVWRDVLGIGDEQLARIIRQDQIDILVDLTMHNGYNRLLVFARKPAPVQVTYLAYCGTTGLAAIDYRLTDPYLDPPGPDERFYAEQSIRLPETYWCYRPMGSTPAVTALPACQAGQVTFGCLNNFCKVTEPTLAAWTDLLQTLPEARLLLHAKAGSHRQRVRDFLAERKVDPERLTFLDQVSLEDHYRLYERIDVALDPFPYGGGTTSCDALWMGVPVVSLAGTTAVGRAGLSILSSVGLAELVARDVEEYVRLAAALANDLPGLNRLRANLRERMQASPLMDAPRFARNVEAAYRKMWQNWCKSQG